jgi:hypothetical protein
LVSFYMERGPRQPSPTSARNRKAGGVKQFLLSNAEGIKKETAPGIDENYSSREPTASSKGRCMQYGPFGSMSSGERHASVRHADIASPETVTHVSYRIALRKRSFSKNQTVRQGHRLPVVTQDRGEESEQFENCPVRKKSGSDQDGSKFTSAAGSTDTVVIHGNQ